MAKPEQVSSSAESRQLSRREVRRNRRYPFTPLQELAKSPDALIGKKISTTGFPEFVSSTVVPNAESNLNFSWTVLKIPLFTYMDRRDTTYNLHTTMDLQSPSLEVLQQTVDSSWPGYNLRVSAPELSKYDEMRPLTVYGRVRKEKSGRRYMQIDEASY